MTLTNILQFISDYTMIYPVIMAYVWMGGAFIFLLSREVFEPRRTDPLPMESFPRLAILVACYNEEANIEETLRNLEEQTYPNLEIIAINDGSKDRTGELLDSLVKDLPRLRCVQLKRNQGKATALRVGHAATNAEYVIVVDADVLLEPDVGMRMVYRLERNPRLGAVTGNPRIRNRGSLLGRIQTGEYSSVVGTIKRAESAYGRLFSVSGCIAGFRHSAVQEVGYWSVDMATEDVDISWRLQLNGWLVEYEPAAICWVLMPETLRGLWKQRLRWAQGGAEVMARYFWRMFRPRSFWMWPIYAEYLSSILWAFLIGLMLVLGLLGLVIPFPDSVSSAVAIRPGGAAVLALTFFIQSALALAMDRRYDSSVTRQFFWMIWFPLGYWMITASTAVVGVFKALGRSKGKPATWDSPDRGVMHP